MEVSPATNQEFIDRFNVAFAFQHDNVCGIGQRLKL